MSPITALSNGNWLNLRRIRVYPRLFLILFVLFGTAWIAGLHEKIKPFDGAYVTDFINVYAAGLAVHEGHPALAYDWDNQVTRQNEIRHNLNEGRTNIIPIAGCVSWVYPPMFLGIAWLVAFLPYWAALVAYSLAGLAFYAAAMRKFLPPAKEAYWALAAFPGTFVNLFAGQNGTLTTALLAGGLFLLEKAPIAAGILFGALSYKPHFFVLIPLVLFAGRHWKALAATCVSAGVTAGLSFAAFGAESWQAFFGRSGHMAGLLQTGGDRWLGTVHSVFSAVRIIGGSIDTAYAVQGIVTGFALLALIQIWRSKSASLAVRGSFLAAAALLISPYSFVYDQVLLAIPIALLAKQGLQSGFLSFEKTFLFALWLLPLLVQDSFPHFALPLTPPLLIGLMALCWRRGKEKVKKPKYWYALWNRLLGVSRRFRLR